jgi:hypothetical protein
MRFLGEEKREEGRTKGKKKSPPAGAGCGAEPQFSNDFHRKHGGRKKTFKRRDKGESQIK